MRPEKASGGAMANSGQIASYLSRHPEPLDELRDPYSILSALRRMREDIGPEPRRAAEQIRDEVAPGPRHLPTIGDPPMINIDRAKQLRAAGATLSERDVEQELSLPRIDSLPAHG